MRPLDCSVVRAALSSPDVDEVLDLSSAGGHALIENNVYFTKPKKVIPVSTDGVLDLSIKGKALYLSSAVEVLEETSAEVQTNLELNEFVEIVDAVEDTEDASEGSANFSFLNEAFSDSNSLDVSPTNKREELTTPIDIDVVTPNDNEVISFSASDVSNKIMIILLF